MKRLEMLRALAGMTKVDLARASGVSRPTIQKLESGGSAEAVTLVKLAKALKVPPEEMRGLLEDVDQHDDAA